MHSSASKGLSCFCFAARTHHIQQARDDLRIQLVPERIGAKSQAPSVRTTLATQAFLETVNTPHRIAFVKYIGCAPEIIDTYILLPCTLHRFPLQKIGWHLFTVSIARHP